MIFGTDVLMLKESYQTTRDSQTFKNNVVKIKCGDCGEVFTHYLRIKNNRQKMYCDECAVRRRRIAANAKNKLKKKHD